MRRTEPVSCEPGRILLGTVALEPNRWGALSPDRKPVLTPRDWLARAREAGFDGIELWENHAMLASDAEVEALSLSPVPIEIWSSYVSFDDPEDSARDAVAEWVGRLGCAAVKFNVGKDREDSVAAYAKRLERFAMALPDATHLICECHMGTAADDPIVAQKILAAAGSTERFRALVHLGDDAEYLDSMFDALGDRITHVHVNFLRQGAPPLSTIASDLRERIARIESHGFEGNYTIEFVHGLGTEADRPTDLLEAAIRDLAVLRETIG